MFTPRYTLTMPTNKRRNFRRKKAPMRRKRAYRKKALGRASRVIVKSPQICPDRYFVKLRFYERIVLTSLGGAFQNYQWRGNSLYDPNFTGGGLQPPGYDQLKLLYNQYRVYCAKIVMVWATVGPSSPSSTMRVGCACRPTTNLPANFDEVVGNPYSRTALVNLGNQSKCVTKMYMSTAKIEGISKRQVMDNDDQYAAPIGSNPNEQWYIDAFCESVDLATTATCVVYATITYYSEFYNRRLLQDA